MKKVLATMFLVGCFFCANASFAGETANSTPATKCNCAKTCDCGCYKSCKDDCKCGCKKMRKRCECFQNNCKCLKQCKKDFNCDCAKKGCKCNLSLKHISRCRRSYACRSRWSPNH